MFITTRAIVLRSIRYSEADLIVTCYTASDGLKSYLLKGILKSKKSKLKAALFQPFNYLTLVARHNNKGRLNYLKEAKLINVNTQLQQDIHKASLSLFLAEVIQNAIQEEEKNTPLFQFLEDAVYWLEKHDDFANFHLYFLVEFTRYLGIYPNYTSLQNSSFFNLQQGSFQSHKSDEYVISGTNCELLIELLNRTASETAELKLNREKRQNFLSFILSYYELQLTGFRLPKSLEVLHQLFAF